MHAKPSAHPQPPAPPQPQPRIRVGRVQAIGVSVLALLPVVALTGLLGERRQHAHHANGDLELQIDYPMVLRFKTSRLLQIGVHNQGRAPLSQLTVQIEQSYLQAFTHLQTTPPMHDVTTLHQQLTLETVPPGQTRRVLVTLEAAHYGRHAGKVRVADANGREATAVAISTLVLP
jgi:hypothetical protein